MRLYSLTGATAVDGPRGHFEAGPDNAFEFPQDMADELHSFHPGGRPAWEDDAERAARLAAEEMERMRDPATLLKAIQQQNELVAATLASRQAPTVTPAASVSSEPAGVPEKPVVKRSPRRSTKTTAADAAE